MGLGRGCLRWVAALSVAWVGLVLVAGAQSGTDGAIGGRVLSAAGVPVAGALVVVRETDTELSLRARSGQHGEFLVVHLPVGEYEVTVEDAGARVTLPGTVRVGLGYGNDSVQNGPFGLMRLRRQV